MLLDHLQKQLASAAQRQLAGKKQKLAALAAGMDAMSPLKVLARGYSMTKDAQGHVITDVSAVSPGDAITVTLSAGRLHAVVSETEGETHEEN